MISLINLYSRIAKYGKMIEGISTGLSWENKEIPQGKVTFQFGRRYVKVIVGNRIHTFVDLNNGDILKAASYKAPAKNGVRGNIWAADFGRSSVDWFGAVYLR